MWVWSFQDYATKLPYVVETEMNSGQVLFRVTRIARERLCVMSAVSLNINSQVYFFMTLGTCRNVFPVMWVREILQYMYMQNVTKMHVYSYSNQHHILYTPIENGTRTDACHQTSWLFDSSFEMKRYATCNHTTSPSLRHLTALTVCSSGVASGAAIFGQLPATNTAQSREDLILSSSPGDSCVWISNYLMQSFLMLLKQFSYFKPLHFPKA